MHQVKVVWLELSTLGMATAHQKNRKEKELLNLRYLRSTEKQ